MTDANRKIESGRVIVLEGHPKSTASSAARSCSRACRGCSISRGFSIRIRSATPEAERWKTSGSRSRGGQHGFQEDFPGVSLRHLDAAAGLSRGARQEGELVRHLHLLDGCLLIAFRHLSDSRHQHPSREPGDART